MAHSRACSFVVAPEGKSRTVSCSNVILLALLSPSFLPHSSFFNFKKNLVSLPPHTLCVEFCFPRGLTASLSQGLRAHDPLHRLAHVVTQGAYDV